jgi:putative chitinase
VKFDHTKFFDLYRSSFGSLTQSKVDGLESLLNSLEADDDVDDERWASYMFATVKHECADTCNSPGTTTTKR